MFKKLQDEAQITNVYNDPQKQALTPGVAATINGKTITIRELSEECISRHGEQVLDQLVNRKLLEVEHVSHACVLTQGALDRLQQPTVVAGQRVSALRFGDPRVMALSQAITGFTHLPRGFRNRDLRPHVEALWGRPYSAAQMTYDLRRLRLKGLIHRIPKTHRYTATSYGLKVAFFYAKLYLRIFRPNWAALIPTDDRFPRALRAALDVLDREIQKLHEEAALAA